MADEKELLMDKGTGQTVILKSWGVDGILSVPTIRYQKAEIHLDSLKRWLFKAVSKNDTKVVRYVSKLIARSFDNFRLSWKRVTTSTGSKTAGVDKVKWKHKDFSHFIRAFRMFKDSFGDSKKSTYRTKPLRRVNIPKPDGSQRPLGIPTLSDRLIQSIYTPAIEVINEVLIHKYKLSTFGFRKSCRAQDAINCLSADANQGKNAMVIDMDIAKCFDKINHKYILNQIEKFGLHKDYQNWIKQMLHSGFVEMGTLHETNEGTPQGGVISPALCNLVVRQVLDIPVVTTKVKAMSTIKIVSYADDAVITLVPEQSCKKETISKGIQTTMQLIRENLKRAGLEIKESKTRIITDDTPFDFLGFEIQRGKGIRPSPKKIQTHHLKVKTLLRTRTRISNVNAVIRGFYNYYAHFSSGRMWKAIKKLDWYNRRWMWKKGLNPKTLISFTDVPKTTKYRSPTKGSTPLISEDVKFYQDRQWTPRKKYLANVQKDRCPVCNQRLGRDPSYLETHHILHKANGGKDKNTNVWLIHQSCHQQRHTLEG